MGYLTSFLLIFLPLIITVNSLKLQQCNQVSFLLNTTLPAGEVVYQLKFMVNVTKTKQYFNDVELYNFERWSLNDTYVETYPLEFFAEDMDYPVLCNQTLSTCGIQNYRDGLGTVMLSLRISSWEEIGEFFMNFWFMEGTVYNSRSGQMYDPINNNCFYDYIDWGEIIFKGEYCCTNYFESDVPDPTPDDDICMEFYSNTNFTASNGTLISHVGILYGIFNDSVAASVNQYQGPPPAIFTLSPNLDEYVKACEDNSVQVPCVVVQPRNDTSMDHVYNWIITVADWHIPGYDLDAIAGQLVYRQGRWMKNLDKPIPYTKSDPCWTRIDDANNNTIASSKFCCRKWVDESNQKCAKYQTKTYSYLNNAKIDYLYSEYVLNQNNTMTVNVLDYTTSSNNIKLNYQLELYSTNGNAQFCSGDATNSQKTCLFSEMTKTNTLMLRTSDYSDGWDIANIDIDGQKIVLPSITPSQPCHQQTYPYNGIGTNTEALTEICCIASSDGFWPGSI